MTTCGCASCAQCSHYEQGQRQSQQAFVCKNTDCRNFDEELSAGYNAALNISRSTAILSAPEDCAYYKQQNSRPLTSE